MPYYYLLGLYILPKICEVSFHGKMEQNITVSLLVQKDSGKGRALKTKQEKQPDRRRERDDGDM